MRRRDDDHLSLVAGITARQRKALVARELDTVERLAAAPIPFDPPLDGTSAASVERVREQARIQVEGRGAAEADPRAAPAEAGRADRARARARHPARARSPATCSSTSRATRTRSTTASTTSSASSTSHGEFTRDLVVRPRRAGRRHAGRREARVRAAHGLPHRAARALSASMHVYHYASYEPTALKRLMGRHGTREERGRSAPPRRRPRRPVPRRAPGPSRIGRELLASSASSRSTTSSAGGPARRRLEHRRVRGVAPARRRRSAALRHPRLDRDLQPRRRAEHAAPPRLARAASGSRSREQPARTSRGRRPARRTRRSSCARPMRASRRSPTQLTDGVPDDRDGAQRRPACARGCSPSSSPGIAARRRSRSGTSSIGMGMDVAELTADKEALGPLEVVGPIGEPWKPTPRAKFCRQTLALSLRAAGLRHRPAIGSLRPRKLPRQQPGREDGARGRCAPSTWSSTRRVDRRPRPGPAGRRARRTPRRSSRSNIYGDKEQRAALLRARRVGRRRTGSTPPGRGAPRATCSSRVRRRSARPPGEPLRGADESELDAACRSSRRSTQARSPSRARPGSGKTYTGARMIVRLLARRQAGRHQRQQPQGHRQLPARGPRGRGRGRRRAAASRRSPRTTDAVDDDRVSRSRRRTTSVQDGLSTGDVQRGRGNGLAVGARARATGCVDVLFVDEAGQMSLANVLRHVRARRARSSCSAIRSSSTSRSRARIRPAPTGRPWRTCSATTTRCRSTSASSSSTPGGSIPT